MFKDLNNNKGCWLSRQLSTGLCNYFHLDNIPGQVIFIACKEELPSSYLKKKKKNQSKEHL